MRLRSSSALAAEALRLCESVTPPIPTIEPTRIAAGETVQWTRSVPDYPSTDGWALKYYLRGVGTLDVTADADPNSAGGYLITVKASDTQALAAGTYRWFAFVEQTIDGVLQRWRVDEGELQLELNPVTAAAGAYQSHAERLLAAIEARLEGRLQPGADMEQYGVAGRQVMKIPAEKLHGMRVRYQAEVARQRNGGVLPPYEAVMAPRRVPTGFGNGSSG